MLQPLLMRPLLVWLIGMFVSEVIMKAGLRDYLRAREADKTKAKINRWGGSTDEDVIFTSYIMVFAWPSVLAVYIVRLFFRFLNYLTVISAKGVRTLLGKAKAALQK